MHRLTALVLSLLMLTGGLVPGNDLGALAKLPELARHYRYHHSAAGGRLSAGEFLAAHYGPGRPRHFGGTAAAWHQHDHQQLPLHDGHVSTWVGFVLTSPLRVSWPRPLAGSLPAFGAAPAPRYRFALGAGLLQPPRA